MNNVYSDIHYAILANIRWKERTYISLNNYLAEKAYRLPTTIKPSHYTIRFRPDIYKTDEDGNLSPSDFEFTGTVTMDLECYKTTRFILFHTRLIELVDDSLVVERDDEVLSYLSITYDSTTEIVTVLLEESLSVGDVFTLTVEYSGPIRNDMGGMYYSYYWNPEETERQ